MIRHRRPKTSAAAILRIGASLDRETVLCEAVGGARALTGARYGAISASTVPESPLDFVTSGLTPEERGMLAAWPDCVRRAAPSSGLRRR